MGASSPPRRTPQSRVGPASKWQGRYSLETYEESSTFRSRLSTYFRWQFQNRKEYLRIARGLGRGKGPRSESKCHQCYRFQLGSVSSHHLRLNETQNSENTVLLWKSRQHSMQVGGRWLGALQRTGDWPLRDTNQNPNHADTDQRIWLVTERISTFQRFKRQDLNVKYSELYIFIF